MRYALFQYLYTLFTTNWIDDVAGGLALGEGGGSVTNVPYI